MVFRSSKRLHIEFSLGNLIVLLLLAIVILSQPSHATFNIEFDASTLQVFVDNAKVIDHSADSPFVFIGLGDYAFVSHLGNFNTSDYVEERIKLVDFNVSETGDGIVEVAFHRDGQLMTTATFSDEEDHNNVIRFSALPDGYNHIWIRLYAEEDEHVYGGGEQFSYFDLRGNTFPIWIREQGVGRNPSTEVTFMANSNDGGGGDYHTTYWAQPTFVSTRKYYCHFSTSNYGELNFAHEKFHEIQIWGTTPEKMYFETGATYTELVTKLSGFLGRQPLLPEWLHKGAVLGVQGGTDAMLGYLEQAQKRGIRVSGMWIQDWAGRITTSFGRRLFWNWEWDPEQYPNLDVEIKNLKEKGIYVTAYINPNLNKEGDLYKEADGRGYFVKNSTGHTYIVDYGEFYCGIMDLTNPDAANWYKNEVIRKNMIDFGFGGWMADFGEYLPTDGVFYSGESGEVLHNKWPALWAQVNEEAVQEAGKLGEIIFWMRAGYTGSQRYSTITWAGDQFVDWSLDDGLASVIPAALSLGMSGYGLHHFDTGGYTSLFGITRTEELLLRYAEFAAFTPMMRTHEGNRPSDNWQFYSSDQTMYEFARHTKIFHLLSNYTKTLVKENNQLGIPVQRPLFMHYESDSKCYDIKYQYLYGTELLVAPVYAEGKDTWEVYLPGTEQDIWVFIWDDTKFTGGELVEVDAPLGKIPVFYKDGSEWAEVFRQIAAVPTDGSNQLVSKTWIVLTVIIAASVTGVIS